MKKVLLSISLSCGLFACHAETKDPQNHHRASAETTKIMGTVTYGSIITSVPLYDAKIPQDLEYFYSPEKAAGQSIDVKMACVIDLKTGLVKVVHYTYACPIGTCPDKKQGQALPAQTFLGVGTEIHLDPDKNQMDCGLVPVQIPPHPKASL